ncbi:MAG TPA: hypothetical protein IAC62_01680 [Candidatus Pelethocola excrementipullorum]|nr:hypothetical protein [Candidatus Pelethocola excrementipullorum]
MADDLSITPGEEETHSGCFLYHRNTAIGNRQSITSIVEFILRAMDIDHSSAFT